MPLRRSSCKANSVKFIGKYYNGMKLFIQERNASASGIVPIYSFIKSSGDIALTGEFEKSFTFLVRTISMK